MRNEDFDDLTLFEPSNLELFFLHNRASCSRSASYSFFRESRRQWQPRQSRHCAKVEASHRCQDASDFDDLLLLHQCRGCCSQRRLLYSAGTTRRLLAVVILSQVAGASTEDDEVNALTRVASFKKVRNPDEQRRESLVVFEAAVLADEECSASFVSLRRRHRHHDAENYRNHQRGSTDVDVELLPSHCRRIMVSCVLLEAVYSSSLESKQVFLLHMLDVVAGRCRTLPCQQHQNRGTSRAGCRRRRLSSTPPRNHPKKEKLVLTS